MKRFKIILLHPVLFIIDVGIYLTIGGHWKTIRRYTKAKLTQALKKEKALKK